jgi:diguanylate cyclase (GGDEF)-like protein
LISLKKYLDMRVDEVRVNETVSSDLLAALVASYRSALLSIGRTGTRAFPALGSDLQNTLEILEHRLAKDLSPAVVKETGEQMTNQLRQWGERVAAHSEAEGAKLKELLILLAQTAASVGGRDQSNTKNLDQFMARLGTIANLNDLTQMRTSLVQQATELKTYVDKMKQESNNLVSQLQTKVSGYEEKLKKAEEFARRDSLTGLANRRIIEERIESRIVLGGPFCVIMADMNRLKKVNDTHGHQAGDELLQQFSNELKSSFRTFDLVGRWGGDEFVIVLDGDAVVAQTQIGRLQKWVFGDYTIHPAKGAAAIKIKVDAAVGMAEWRPGESKLSLIERADAAMYAQKAQERK